MKSHSRPHRRPHTCHSATRHSSRSYSPRWSGSTGADWPGAPQRIPDTETKKDPNLTTTFPHQTHPQCSNTDLFPSLLKHDCNIFTPMTPITPTKIWENRIPSLPLIYISPFKFSVFSNSSHSMWLFTIVLMKIRQFTSMLQEPPSLISFLSFSQI